MTTAIPTVQNGTAVQFPRTRREGETGDVGDVEDGDNPQQETGDEQDEENGFEGVHYASSPGAVPKGAAPLREKGEMSSETQSSNK
jgi:hypothetical protein